MNLAERGEAASKHWRKTVKPPKTITAKIVVPEWAKWRATDKNGSVFVYSEKPSVDGAIWSLEKGTARFLHEATTPPRNWRKTLRRVK